MSFLCFCIYRSLVVSIPVLEVLECRGMPENSENDPFCDEKLALNFKRIDDMIETRQNL